MINASQKSLFFYRTRGNATDKQILEHQEDHDDRDADGAQGREQVMIVRARIGTAAKIFKPLSDGMLGRRDQIDQGGSAEQIIWPLITQVVALQFGHARILAVFALFMFSAPPLRLIGEIHP